MIAGEVSAQEARNLIDPPYRFAISEEETRELFALAKENGVFVMEALWSRFIPAYLKLEELIKSGAIGGFTCSHVKLLHASRQTKC